MFHIFKKAAVQAEYIIIASVLLLAAGGAAFTLNENIDDKFTAGEEVLDQDLLAQGNNLDGNIPLHLEQNPVKLSFGGLTATLTRDQLFQLFKPVDPDGGVITITSSSISGGSAFVNGSLSDQELTLNGISLGEAAFDITFRDDEGDEIAGQLTAEWTGAPPTGLPEATITLTNTSNRVETISSIVSLFNVVDPDGGTVTINSISPISGNADIALSTNVNITPNQPDLSRFNIIFEDQEGDQLASILNVDWPGFPPVAAVNQHTITSLPATSSSQAFSDLINSIFTVTDPDGGAISITAITPLDTQTSVSHTINSNILNLDFLASGIDRYRITFADNENQTVQTTLTARTGGAPNLANSIVQVTIPHGDDFTHANLVAAFGATDPDGGPVTIDSTNSQTSDMTASLSGQNIITNHAVTGTFDTLVTFSDPDGQTVTGTLRVLWPGLPPSVTDHEILLNESETQIMTRATFGGLFNPHDNDDGGDVTLDSFGTHSRTGVATISADATNVTLQATGFGETIIPVTFIDDENQTATASLTVIVLPPREALFVGLGQEVCADRNDIAGYKCWEEPNEITDIPDFEALLLSADKPGFGTVNLSPTTACVLKNGDVHCFGQNTMGAVDGQTTTPFSPDAPFIHTAGNGGNFTMIAGGTNAYCALRDDGITECWGDNTNCSLGRGNGGGGNANTCGTGSFPGGTPTSKGVATGIFSLKDIYGDGNAFCGHRTSDDRLVCWGMLDFGGSPLGGKLNTGFITHLAGDEWDPLFTNTHHVSPGRMSLCAIDPNNTLYCAGTDHNGSMTWSTTGEYIAGTNLPTNEPVAWGGNDFRNRILDFSKASNALLCVLRDDFRVFCAGYDIRAIPPADPNVQLYKTKEPYELTALAGARRIVVTAAQVCGMFDAGDVKCVHKEMPLAERNSDGTEVSFSNPPVSAASPEVLIAENSTVTLTLAQFLTLYQITDPENDAISIDSIGPSSALNTVSITWNGTDIIMTGGDLGGKAEATVFLKDSRNTPAQVTIFMNHDKIIPPSTSNTIFSYSNGFCMDGGATWHCYGGTDYFDTNGNGNFHEAIATPASTTFSQFFENNLAKAPGGMVSGNCVIASFGTPFVTCFGLNDRGQHSPGNTSPAAGAFIGFGGEFPTTPEKIAQNYFSTCVILQDQDVYCWGTDKYRSLGKDNSDTSEKNSATFETVAKATLIPKLKEIWGGGHGAFCGRRASDDAIICWGQNFGRQFGVSAIATADPIEIPEYKDATELRLNNSSICARFGGTFKCSGQNHGKTMSDIAETQRYFPRDAITWAGLTDLTHIAMGTMTKCGIRTNGQIWCNGVLITASDGTQAFNGKTNTPYLVYNPGTGPKAVSLEMAGCCSLVFEREDGTYMEVGFNPALSIYRPSPILINLP